MNRKIIAGLAVAASLFASFFLVRSGDARRKELSPTRRVVVDGSAFESDESPPDAGSLLGREPGWLGVALPEEFTLPEESNPPHPAFEGRLKEFRQRSREAVRLPKGLTAEHTLRMEGEGAPVDLVFGTFRTPGASIRSRLLSDGWESVSAGDGSGGMHVLQSVRGKETFIVCLDDAESAFLLFREVGR